MEPFVVLLSLAALVCAIIALSLASGARRHLNSLDGYLRNLARRVHDLERARDAQPVERVTVEAPAAPAKPPPPPPPPRPAPPPKPLVHAPWPPPVREPEPELEPLPAELARAPEPTAAKPAREPRPSLEERIGGRWFNWVGILAILFGVAYAMKYSFDKGWVTPRMRFWSGLALGVALLAAGGFSERRRYAILARGFWAGGIGVLLVVFFAGFKLLLVNGEPIIGRPIAFAGMAATVLAGVLISIVYNARTTAALSAVAGYLVPVLLRTGHPDQVFLFTYLLILTGGLLFLGYWKRWGFLRLLTFAVVVAYFSGWWLTQGTGAPWAMLLYPSAVFAFFATEIVAWSAWRRVADGGPSYVVLGLATTLHTLSGLSVTHDHFTAFRGIFLLATAAYLLLGARTVSKKHPEDWTLAACYGWAAGALFLLWPAFEPRVHGSAHGCVWALQGAAFLLASERWGARGHTRWFGYAAFAIAAGRLGLMDTPQRLVEVHPYLPFWNVRALVYAIVIAAFTAGCWLSRRREKAAPVGRNERLATTALYVAGLSLPAILLSLELAQALSTYAAPGLGGENTRAYRSQSGHWMTLLWAVYATLTATVTARRGFPVLRNFALGFGGFVLAKFVARDLLATYVTEVTPIVNSRFAVTAALAVCAFWSAREFRWPALLGFGGAHALVLLGLSMEWVDLCETQRIAFGAPWFGLTILYAAYGTALLVLSASQRLVALGLVMAAAVKFALLDLPSVAEMAPSLFLQMRFLAGAAAAGACLFAATRGWQPLLRLLGHAVLVLTLSAETVDLFDRRLWDHGWFATVGLWACYAYGALCFGHARARRDLRGFGLVLLWVALVAGVMLLPTGHRTAQLLLNPRFIGLGLVALGLLRAAEFYRKGPPPDPPLRWSSFSEGASLAVPLVLAGHALAMLLLILEAADHFHLAGAAAHMRQLSYSLILATYAIGMVIAGFLRKYRPVRLMALGVLIGTIFKVFLRDLSFLENPYRMLSFLALGAILVAVSFLYQRFRHVLA